ncbi:ABC transporter permease [Tissierella carlieri]|uniref:ABC transporter permease n=1 Tax=Tissierella carlieri TaxID=689904 RepID=A0ABT1S8M2_9FIRM|nr:ABC transporter permease [Tissierella carlieri]MCQ4922695.1 ABC transporter permease [Tissierella carlieri]MDU5082772.1 ABC transporter permease [Bacillota bacterium]
MTKYFYLFKVSMEKTLKELSRYKFNTISDIIIFYVLFMAMFLGVKSFGINFGISPIDMGSSLEGFIVGYFLWTIMLMAYSGAAYGIIHDANRGTLEQLNMSGIKLSTIVTARSLSDLLVNLIISIVLLFIIMVTTNYQLEIKIFSILFPIFIGIFSILGIGLIFGGLALIFKKIQSLLNIVQYFLIALVMVSPENKIIYNLLPFRPAADKVMLSMRKGYSLVDFSIYDYGIMVGNSILYFSIGLLVFNKCVKLAKRKGLLGQY